LNTLGSFVAVACVVAALALAVALVARERRLARERERLLLETLHGIADTAALGSLLRSFAHAGNNRLTVILACLDVLETTGLDDEDQRAAVRLALGSARQLADDLALLQAAGRRDTRERQPRSVVAALSQAQRLQDLLGDERSFSMSFEASPDLKVECEHGRLELALLRLCLFARRREATALHVRGVELELVERDPERPSLRPGRYCQLEFRFDGATLPAVLCDALTEPGHVACRLREPDGLEFAAVEAFAAQQRGLARASTAGATAPVVELILPIATPATP
jgi:hypothetical protein